MSSLKRWLFFVMLTPIFILFGNDLDVNNIIVVLYMFVLLTYPFFSNIVKNQFFSGFHKDIFIILIGIAFIILNIILSNEPINSLLYWIMYLLYIYGINLWVRSIYLNGKIDDFLYIIKYKLGNYIFVSVLIIFFGLTFFNWGNGKTFNTLGIISGSAIVYFWFSKHKTYIKVLLILILGFFIFTSLSRSSLIISFTSILLTELFLFGKHFLRKFVLVALIIVGFIVYKGTLIGWFEKKEVLTKLDPNNEVVDLFSEMNSDRKELIDNFFAVYDKNFFTGYGINTPYQKLPDWDAVNNIGVHNGVLEMILVIGVPLSLIFLYFYTIVLKKIYILAKRNTEYSSILGFVIYITLRSYGESYFLLNIGNIMSILFLMILVFFYNYNIAKFKRRI